MPDGSMAQRTELVGLLLYPREDLHIELKAWLDLREKAQKANLAQALLAIANHGGGYVVIGFSRTGPENYEPAEGRPPSLDDYKYTQDTVNEIVQRYADPPFHCNLEIVSHPQTQESFPIITVPGGHRFPIRCRKSGPNNAHVTADTYYIRRSGPQSAPPQNPLEWEALLRRCLLANRDTLLEDFRNILSGMTSEPPETAQAQGQQEEFKEWLEQSRRQFQSLLEPRYIPELSPYRHGIYEVAYAIVGEGPSITLPDLRDILIKVEGTETGWPPWWSPNRDPIRPYPTDGSIQCWIWEPNRTSDPGHIDFWRASHNRMLFLIRGYEEDGGAYGEPGIIFDPILPIWRVGECLLHAGRFAEAVGQAMSDVIFQVTWTGLENRRLEVLQNRRRVALGRPRVAHQAIISSEIIVPAQTISINLERYVRDLTRPLYHLFDFYEPSGEMYSTELSDMQSRSVRSKS